jgi:hypothetical protein
MIRLIRTARGAVLVSLLLTTGCAGLSAKLNGPQSSGTASAPATGAAPSATASGAAHALVSVHDPKVVTYSRSVTVCHVLPGPRPDPACTPGSFDPSVTQANIAGTICRSGYTDTVRPSVSLTNKAKKSLYGAYGIPTGTTSELDHLVSLELGGSNDVTNLWPEVGKVPNPKDSVENALHKAVCSGKVPLAAAQQAIASNWQTAESVLGIGGQ